MERELPEFAKVLPMKQHLIFKTLFDKQGNFVSKLKLIDVLWGDDPEGGPLNVEKNLNVQITYLRKALPEGWIIEGRYLHGNRLIVPSSHRQPDISALKSLICKAEEAVGDAQEALSMASADLARTIGPLATAHRLAELALEMADLAEMEAGNG